MATDGPYKVYNVLTNELLGGYDGWHEAHDRHRGQPIQVIYRPSRRKKKK